MEYAVNQLSEWPQSIWFLPQLAFPKDRSQVQHGSQVLQHPCLLVFQLLLQVCVTLSIFFPQRLNSPFCCSQTTNQQLQKAAYCAELQKSRNEIKTAGMDY